jgi:hypothetical protein
MVGVAGVDEARRLLTVDILIKSAMKEGILDVQLVNGPRSRDDDADRGRLDDRAECLIKINSR